MCSSASSCLLFIPGCLFLISSSEFIISNWFFFMSHLLVESLMEVVHSFLNFSTCLYEHYFKLAIRLLICISFKSLALILFYSLI